MQIINCTVIAGVLASVFSLVALSFRPPEGNGFISQQGAAIFASVGIFILFLILLWFPCLAIGYWVKGKSLSKAQKRIHLVFTWIAAIIFFVTLLCAGKIISHHP